MGSSKSKISKKEILKISEATKFTPEEIKHWYRGFMQDCPNGKLNKSEFTNLYGQFFPDGNPEAFATVVFNLFDEDGNGSIDFSEFLMALSITSRGKVDDKLEWAFRLYDIDQNGSVTKDEMIQMINAIVAMTGQAELSDDMHTENRVTKIFEMMDTDGNGELSKEEFIAGAKQDKTILAALSPTMD